MLYIRGERMELIESIACYSRSIRFKIKKVLTNDVKIIIGTLVQNPSFVSCVDTDLLKEFIKLDIIKYIDDKLIPNTAIFFEEDMLLVKRPIEEMREKIADITKKNALSLEACTPEIKNFIGGIMVGQELHNVLKKKRLVSNWQTKTGEYEKGTNSNRYCFFM